MLIAPEEALKIVLSNALPGKPVRMSLDRALNCILAEDVRCDRDQPPKDRSAMDGYAVIASDLQAIPAKLKLIGEVAAGSTAAPRVKPGTCATILTGANLPPGADAVVQVESTERHDDEVIVRSAVKSGQNVRKRGEEARRGQVLLAKGTQLSPARIGICAMVGKSKVSLYPRPNVGVMCTGVELKDTADRVGPHQLRDSNGPALLASLAQIGFKTARRWIVSDDPKAIAARLKRLLRTCQVVILTGGVSVGLYDYVPEVIRSVGAQICFHGIRIKPGRPQLYATFGKNRHIFGLPGNPVSVLTGFIELVLPALRKISGTPAEAVRPSMMLPLTKRARSKGKRTYFCLARLVHSTKSLSAAPLESTGSADLIAASQADGLIVIPAGVTEMAPGSVVEFHPCKPMF